MIHWLHDMRGLTAATAVSVGAHVLVVAALGSDAGTGRHGLIGPAGVLHARIARPVAVPEAFALPAFPGEGMATDAPAPPSLALAESATVAGPAGQNVASPVAGPLALPVSGLRYYRGRELDRRPEALNEVDITYPEEAVRARMQGSMRLDLFISEEGKLDKAVILAADPPAIFDQAVLEAVRALAFSPGVLDGRKVRSVKTIDIPLGAAGDSATMQSAQAPVLQIHIEQK